MIVWAVKRCCQNLYFNPALEAEHHQVSALAVHLLQDLAGTFNVQTRLTITLGILALNRNASALCATKDADGCYSFECSMSDRDRTRVSAAYNATPSPTYS